VRRAAPCPREPGTFSGYQLSKFAHTRCWKVPTFSRLRSQPCMRITCSLIDYPLSLLYWMSEGRSLVSRRHLRVQICPHQQSIAHHRGTRSRPHHYVEHVIGYVTIVNRSAGRRFCPVRLDAPAGVLDVRGHRDSPTRVLDQEVCVSRKSSFTPRVFLGRTRS
jgi:hypothetical protein